MEANMNENVVGSEMDVCTSSVSELSGSVGDSASLSVSADRQTAGGSRAVSYCKSSRSA